MLKMMAILLLLVACKLKIMQPEGPTQVSDQMREVITLSGQEQLLAKSLCDALKEKKSLFRTMHDGKIFDFQLEQYNCGTKTLDSTITGTLRAPIGQAMTYEDPAGGQLYFHDVLTNTEGITHFVCDKLATGKVLQNTITISDVEKIQFRLWGQVTSGVILEIWNYVANAQGEHILKDVHSIQFHVKPSTISDFTGLEMDRSVSKKCPNDGKLSNTLRQKSLEALP